MLNFYVKCHRGTCNIINQVSQLNLLLMKLYHYGYIFYSNMHAKIYISSNLDNQHCCYLFAISCIKIKINGKVHIIKRYLCHAIKKPLAYHFMEFYVTTCEYHSIPIVLWLGYILYICVHVLCTSMSCQGNLFIYYFTG